MVKNLQANAGDTSEFDPWVRKNPWSRKWYPTPVFLPVKIHVQRNLGFTAHGAAKSQTQLCDQAHGKLVVQSFSHVQLFVTLWTAASQVSLSFTVSWSLLELMFIESVISTNHLVLLHPLLLLPSNSQHQDLFQ